MRDRMSPLLVAGMTLVLAAPVARAADDKTPADAKAELKLTQKAFEKKDWPGVLQHSRKAAELAPRSLEVQESWITDHRFVTLTTMTPAKAHDEFVKVYGEYKKKAAREPKDPLWQILLGEVQFYEDPKASQLAFARAVELDPRNADALTSLGVIAETRGNNAEARQFFLRAAQAVPQDPKYLGGYVGSFMDSGDFIAFRDKALELIHKFPDSPEAAKWYYWLGRRADSPEEGRRYLQEAIDKYPVEGKTDDDFGWLTSCYDGFFTSLQKDDPFEAERFARSTMLKFAGHEDLVKEWFGKYRRQAEFNLARAARRAQDPKTALDLIATVEKSAGRYDPMRETIVYEKALAQDAAGDSSVALETLLGLLKSGGDAVVEAAFQDIAKRSGKSESEAETMLWSARMKDAKPFEDFTLKDADGKTVSLHDLKGRIVLVNFWYPSCGPCRGEFPHLEKIVERFHDQPFTVLAINTHPQEGFKVKDFLEGNGYRFRALQTPTEDWAEKNYKVVGTPSNFLLDERGRIVAEPRLYDHETEERLGQLIIELLKKTDGAAPAKAGS